MAINNLNSSPILTLDDIVFPVFYKEEEEEYFSTLRQGQECIKALPGLESLRSSKMQGLLQELRDQLEVAHRAFTNFNDLYSDLVCFSPESWSETSLMRTVTAGLDATFNLKKGMRILFRNIMREVDIQMSVDGSNVINRFWTSLYTENYCEYPYAILGSTDFSIKIPEGANDECTAILKTTEKLIMGLSKMCMEIDDKNPQNKDLKRSFSQHSPFSLFADFLAMEVEKRQK